MLISVLEILLFINLSSLKDPWWGEDKAKHMAVSFIMASSFYTLIDGKRVERKCMAFAFTLSLGILKELYDWRIKKTIFSYRDLIYDFIGIIAAIPP
jgi:uncharacterized protein YfiM (DUF2279 family)